jgi:SAM-dependent methyltransferase
MVELASPDLRRFIATQLKKAPVLDRLMRKLIAPARVPSAQGFVPAPDEWVRGHYYGAVDETAHFCGDIFRDKSVLNVGCGEMLTDFGLLRLGPRNVVGMDVVPRPADHLEQAAAKLRANGIAISAADIEKLSFIQYDGENFPFPDQHFDVVFSWSAFEHVANVPRVLAEIHRVLKPEGRAFIQVYPWFHCLHGSHLTDWIAEPYFQLHRPDDWVREALEGQAAAKPDQADFILGHMLPEYRSLNKKSGRAFYADVRATGFKVLKAKLLSFEQDLSAAPPDVDFADLMIFGTLMLLAR